MINIISVVVVFGVIVFVHELGHFITAKLTGMRVDEFAIGFGPKIASVRKGETLYSIRIIPLGGFNKIAGMEMGSDLEAGERAYWRKPIWARLIVISAGALMNFILPIFLFAGTLFIYGVQTPSPEPIIGRVVADSPAQHAGLVTGDRIISINNHPVHSWEDIIGDIKSAEGTELTLMYSRGNQEREVKLIPHYDNEAKRSLIGITQYAETKHLGILESLGKGTMTVGYIIGQMYHGLMQMITGQTEAQLSGPVGVMQMTSHYAKLGMEALVNFMAILSINLGVINLLPLPALDGGHIVMLILEALRGKPLNPKFLKTVQMIGVVLLLSLMFFATAQDITRIFG